MREARDMHIVSTEVHKERTAFCGTLSDESDGVRGNGIGNILVFPQGPATAFHISDTAYAVDYRLIMSYGMPQIGE